MTYSLFITGFVYPVVSHWGWSGTGWLANPPESAGMPAGVAMQGMALILSLNRNLPKNLGLNILITSNKMLIGRLTVNANQI